MGKIIMSKYSVTLDEVKTVLHIFYEADDWITNEEYKAKLNTIIRDNQEIQKDCVKITSYFGFTIKEDIKKLNSKIRIITFGKKMYEAIKSNSITKVQEVIMDVLEKVKFGRDNHGSPKSFSNVEPLSVYVRAILDMGYLTYREFSFLLWKLVDLDMSYTDVLSQLKVIHNKDRKYPDGFLKDDYRLSREEKNYVSGVATIITLVKFGFFTEETRFPIGTKCIKIAPEVLSKYETRLRNLEIYNDKSIENFEKRENIIDKLDRLKGGINVLLYGVPGCGKSYIIKINIVKILMKLKELFSILIIHMEILLVRYCHLQIQIQEK